MDEVFRHLYMPPQLACQFLAVFSRLEYALKATADFAEGDEDGVRANWDRFGNSINTKFLAIGSQQAPTSSGLLRQAATTKAGTTERSDRLQRTSDRRRTSARTTSFTHDTNGPEQSLPWR